MSYVLKHIIERRLMLRFFYSFSGNTSNSKPTYFKQVVYLLVFYSSKYLENSYVCGSKKYNTVLIPNANGKWYSNKI